MNNRWLRSFLAVAQKGSIIPEFLEQVCAQFRKSHPQLKIELISDENFDGWLDGLRSLKYDIIEHFALDGLCPEDTYFECISRVKTWCIMPDFHPLAQKELVVPEDLDGYRIISPGLNQKLMRYLQFYIEAVGIDITFDKIENSRYQIMENLNRGGIYLGDESISRIFAGYSRVPLEFDNHVQHGLACRKEMVEKYKPFFTLAHEVNAAVEARKNR